MCYADYLTVALVVYPGLRESFFVQSLASLFCQTTCPRNIHIYIEGETPRWDVLKNSRLRLYKLPMSLRGRIAKIREYIVKDTKTPLLAFWDADDIYFPNRLTFQLESLRRIRAAVFVSVNFSLLGSLKKWSQSYLEMIGYSKRKINVYDENFIGLGFSMFRTRFLRSLIPFPEIPVLDWWIAIRARKMKKRWVMGSEPMGYYRLRLEAERTDAAAIRKEIHIKKMLYSHLRDQGLEFVRRYEYYQSLSHQPKGYSALAKRCQQSPFFNFWGGLVPFKKAG